jgi:large subunit ribosomal protein L4
MKKKVYSVDGKEVKTIELNDTVFAREISEGSIYNAIRNELANKRVGSACTKGRSEVKGSGAKPWRQKGTGRARSGHKRSPIWVGGGIAFGPKPRDYSYKMPRKIKRLAIKSILSLKAKDDVNFKIVEDFTVESGKTKDLVTVLKNLVSNERTIIIIKDDDSMVKRASANIANVNILSYNRLNAHDLFYGKNVLVFEGAALKLNEFYAN